MQVLGIVGSMRKDRHTNALVKLILDKMRELEPEVTSEVIHTADLNLAPCRVTCSGYCSKKPFQCSIADDVPEVLRRMINADALVIGAPLYFRGPPAHFQALIERLVSICFFYESNGGSAPSPLRGKPCGLAGVAEYSNPHQVLEYLHDFCILTGMRPVRIDGFPYLGASGQGDIAKDSVFKSVERAADLAAALIRECTKRNEASSVGLNNK